MMTLLLHNIKQILLVTGLIVFACVAGIPQQRSSRDIADIEGRVRTVRLEVRQLHALTYRQSGVMVYTKIYDAKGRLLESAEYLPGGNPDTKFTSAYDDRGNEIEHAYYTHDELSHRTTTRFDLKNRKIEELSFNSNGKQTSKFIFRYDKQGKQTAVEILPGEKIRPHSVAVFNNRGYEIKRTEYDELGAVKHRYVYSYDAAGNKTSDTDKYQMQGRTNSSKNTYIYNGNGNLLEIAYYSNGTLQNKTKYKRDPNGNKIEELEMDGKGLVKERRVWSYEFDQNGNWIRAVISEWSKDSPNEPLQPTFEERQIFASVSNATFALWSAARQGNTERVHELLKQGADVNASHPNGGTGLIKAAAHGHRDAVHALLAAGAEVDRKDAEGWTALMWAAEKGHSEIVKRLLQAGADPNARNAVGGVAIIPASLNGHLEVLQLLLEKGAEVNAATTNGLTALMVCAEKGQTEAMKFLMLNGADPNIKGKENVTAIFFAAAGSNTETVSALLEKGVDVNSKAKGGWTPLMVAATQPEIAVLKFLIEKGAAVSAKTEDGKTALSIALQLNHTEAVALLKQAGAK